MLRLYCRWT